MKLALAILALSLCAQAQLIGNGPPVGQCHVANFGQTIYYTDALGHKNYYCDTMVTPHVWVEFHGMATTWTPDPTINWSQQLPATLAIISIDADGVTLHCTVRAGGPCKF